MKAITHKNFYVIILFVLVMRLMFALFPSFTIDMNNWIAWSRMLGTSSPLNFYSLPAWTDYTPFFLYYLWILGIVGKSVEIGSQLYPFLIKLPAIFADIGIGLLIYRLLFEKNYKIARFAFLAYTINPVVIFANSIWGQTDGLIAFFLLLCVYFLVEKKNIVLSSLFWSISLLIKPQASFCLPVLLIYFLVQKKAKKALLFLIYSAVFALVIGLPFFIYQNPIFGLPKLILKMSNESPFTSVMAFNFWALTPGMWISDALTFLGIKYAYWGAVLLATGLLTIIIKFWKLFKTPRQLYFILGISYLAFFLFPTRVHERYILVSLPFLLLSATLAGSKLEIALYFALSTLSLINIYHPYAYYTQASFLSNSNLLNVTTSSYKFISLLFLLLFLVYIFKDNLLKRLNFRLKLKQVFQLTAVKVNPLPVCGLQTKKLRKFLLIILAFSFITRIAWLGSPGQEYFDEVYHAFTARQILHGNPKAWEWWNTPPEGFAYEWTHPPLAKLGMVMGMKIFGENSFGWRIPGALLGVGSVFLVYLLAKTIFNDELLGVLSSAVFSLEGLPVVMSRIGMNDSYFLFFALLSIYFFLTKKDFYSALAFSLSASSKWSAIWLVPILGLIWFTGRKKIEVSNLWFLLLPPVIYLASYIPLFITGHNLSIFWEMQKQMWWYHTRLIATHPYTSSWWSWPLLLRPIYLYTSNEVGGLVARIYATGNPVVFWFGLLSVICSFFYTLYEKNKKLALVIFSYLIFFVPWAASPRIMFLYHYLPSLPFLAIATGYVLRRNLWLIAPTLTVMFVVFCYFYPHYAGITIPLKLDTSYYWFRSWR